MKNPKYDLLRRVNQIRYFLPVILFLIVASYETWEHILLNREFRFNFHFNMEVLFFGVFGPSAVFLAITYIMRLLEKQITIGQELETLNQGLEEKVAERTEELAARNQDLAQANEELQKLDQLKSDFVSLVSHELRGPLTTLNGGLELALQNAEGLPSEGRRILEVMAAESERLTHFVQTILDVSKLEAGKIELNPGPVAVVPLLKRASQLAFAAGSRPILWKTQESMPPAWADENYLEQIICNLLTNAGKYAPPEMPVEIEARQENGQLAITVSDHGPGIPKEMQPKIFDRFMRLERGERIKSKGWGLGLFFSKSLAEAQGGALNVQSPVRDSHDYPGSAFTLTLPLVEDVPEDA